MILQRDDQRYCVSMRIHTTFLECLTLKMETRGSSEMFFY